MKRWLYGLLAAVCLFFAVMPSAGAADTDIVRYGVTGGDIFFDKSSGAVTDCEQSITAADIPGTIDGVRVTSIANMAFAAAHSLKSVVIPNGVTSIGDCAFISCSGLTSVVIPNSVSSIGIAAFSGCSNLASVNIPNSVTIIRYNTFASCSALKDVYYDGTQAEYKANLLPSIEDGEQSNAFFLNATFHFKDSVSSNPNPTLPNTAARDYTTFYGVMFLVLFALTLMVWVIGRRKKNSSSTA